MASNMRWFQGGKQFVSKLTKNFDFTMDLDTVTVSYTSTGYTPFYYIYIAMWHIELCKVYCDEWRSSHQEKPSIVSGFIHHYYF